MFKALSKGILILSCLMGLEACSNDSVAWKEDVELNDGSIITVGQERKNEGGIVRESQLIVEMPQFSLKPIIWRQSVIPLILNVERGKLYVIGFPPTHVEAKRYGDPIPPYVCFIWEDGAWKRIPFMQVPTSLYKTNLLIQYFPPQETNHLTIKRKNAADLNNEATIPAPLKRLDPNWIIHK